MASSSRDSKAGRRPMVGICAAYERARWSCWDAPAHLIASCYVDAVQRAGGAALLIPADPTYAEDPDIAIERLDALVLAGGRDVDPHLYGAEPHAETHVAFQQRDRSELALLSRCMENGVPLLAICRGMQLLNVASGGTLVQHLPDHLGHTDHCPQPGRYESHEVTLRAGSATAAAVGELRHGVLSHHHQGIERLGEGLAETGWADDGLVEAIELRDHPFALGVQWHPEEDLSSRLIRALVERAGDRP